MRRNTDLEDKYEMIANVQQAALRVRMAHTHYEKMNQDNDNVTLRAQSQLESIERIEKHMYLMSKCLLKIVSYSSEINLLRANMKRQI